MGVELHCVAHDIGHLVEPAVVQTLHRMQDAPLHGFEPIGDIRDGTFQNNIRGVFKKPRLIHAAQMVTHDIGWARVRLQARKTHRLAFSGLYVVFRDVAAAGGRGVW